MIRITMQTLLIAITLVAYSLSVLGAPGLSVAELTRRGPLGVRQADSDYNSTMFPDACLQDCVGIGEVFSNCGEDATCRCTEENAALLADCMNCFVSNTDTADNPSIITGAKATLDQFNSQCASAHDPISLTFALTATNTITMVTMMTPSVQPLSSASTSSTAHRVLRGAIAGGIVGGIALITLSLWWYFFHHKPMLKTGFSGKERPFYHLEEPGIPMNQPVGKKGDEADAKTRK